MTIRIVNGVPLAVPDAAADDDAELDVELPAAALVALELELELELEPQAPMASATATFDNDESATPRALMNEPRIYSLLRLLDSPGDAPSRCVLTGSDDFLPTVWYTLAAVSAAVKMSIKFP